MRQGIFTEIDWAFIGANLARESDEDQAKFLKAFIKECASWGTTYQVQLQLAGVNRLLTKDEKETLSMLSFSE